MQKFTLTLSVILIVLVSFLFFILFGSLKRQIITEKERTERFLNMSVALAVNSIQDEVEFAYRELQDICEETIELGIFDEDEILKRIDGRKLSGRYVDQMFDNRTFIEFERDFSGQILSERGDIYPYRYFSDVLKREELREMIVIDNFTGLMIFPLGRIKDGGSLFLLYKLDLRNVVADSLPRLVKSFMADTPNMIEANLSTFSSRVVYGHELKEEELSEQKDLIIDLNRIFNMNSVFDYHKSRQERDYIHFEKISNIVDNHLYLSLQHESGSIELFFRNKVRYYLAGLLFLYIFTVCAILSILYTTYRVRRSVMREKEFTAMISHELKTPLSVIKLGADNLAGGFVGDRGAVAEYGQMISEESEKLGSMIEKILSISGTLNNKAISLFTTYSVEALSADLEEQCRSLLESKRVELVVQFDNSRDSLLCNKMTLTGALFNILQNSIIYGAADSHNKRVYLRFSDEKRKGREGLLVQIRDNGPGISWKEAQRIFIPYYRGRAGRERQISGTGLGLAISRKIIREHKGQISLNRSLRKETVFQVWIPYRIKNEKNTHD